MQLLSSPTPDFRLSDRDSRRTTAIYPKFRHLVLGPLPTAALGKAGILLGEGEVHFRIPAQKHAFNRHPDTFMSCVPFLSETVVTPTHVGQSPRHANDGFELVREIKHAGLIVLVSVFIKPSNNGIYGVTSTYPIDRSKLEARLRKGHLVET